MKGDGMKKIENKAAIHQLPVGLGLNEHLCLKRKRSPSFVRFTWKLILRFTASALPSLFSIKLLKPCLPWGNHCKKVFSE